MLDKYITYITSFFPYDIQHNIQFKQSDDLAIAKVNAYLGGSCIKTEQYYHIVVLNGNPPNLLESNKTIFFNKRCLIMLPPNRTYTLSGKFALNEEYYYVIIKKQVIEKIITDLFGFCLHLNIVHCHIQVQTIDILNKLEVELTEKRFGYETVAKYLLSLLITYLLRNSNVYLQGNIMNICDITKVCEYITDYCSSDITVEDLANVANMSKYHFIRRFKQSTGFTPHQFIKNNRLNMSYRYLIDTQLSISEIGKICGFVNASHFTSEFKKMYQKTPSQCRQTKSG